METTVTVDVFVSAVVIGTAVVDTGVVLVEKTPGWVLFTTVHNETQIG